MWSLGELAEAERDSLWPAPAKSAFEYIAGFTADGTDHTYNFTSISQTYDSLRVVAYIKEKASNQWRPYVRLNGDTSSYYYVTTMYGDGGGFGSASYSNTVAITMPLTPYNDYPYVYTMDLPGYNSSSIVSPTLSYTGMWNNNGSESPRQIMVGGLWNGTAAITSIRLYDQNSYTLASGSTVALFGKTGD